MAYYPYLPQIITTEVDKSVVPNIAQATLKFAGVIGSKWGPPELFFCEGPASFVKKYTWDNASPDRGDTAWFMAYYMLTQGVPLYVKRVYGATARCGNLVIGTAAGTTTPIAGGTSYVTASSYTFSAGQLMLIYTYPGAYGSNYGIKVVNVSGTNYTFDIEFYTYINNVATLVQTGTFSRKKIKDGYGNNIYVESRIEELDLPFHIVDSSKADTILPKTNGSVVRFAGGVDGTTPSDAAIAAGWTSIQESSEDYRVCLTMGYALSATVASTLSTLANNRDYNVAMCDAPNDTKVNLSTWRNSAPTNNRVFLFAEYFKYTEPFYYENIWLPPVAIAATLLSRNRASDPFKSIAGMRRGTFDTLGLYRNYSKSDLNDLIAIQINPLAKLGGQNVLLEQLTSQRTKSVLSDINVRMLFDYINEVSTDYLVSFIHEFNDPATRTSIQVGVQKVLDYLVNRGDLTEGLVICDESNNPSVVINAGELYVDQYIKPPKAARVIHNRLIALPQGVSIEELI